jgi:hypothetical protein
MAKKTISNNAAASKIDSVHIRMYCMGTGDCFILKFCSGESTAFTMMVDCGSCQGGPQEFAPYIDNLATYVKGELDLLVVTHEHNDHVNGFAKCEKVFADPSFHIKEAWFAWTEDPADPDGRAAELQKKRSKMRLAFEKVTEMMRQWKPTHRISMQVWRPAAGKIFLAVCKPWQKSICRKNLRQQIRQGLAASHSWA